MNDNAENRLKSVFVIPVLSVVKVEEIKQHLEWASLLSMSIARLNRG